MHHLIEEIELADKVGLDVFGIGEHHRAEFLDSAPAVILSAAAARTENIRLTSAVTVLSASDPFVFFQEFATLDLISRGRAECRRARFGPTATMWTYGRHLASNTFTASAFEPNSKPTDGPHPQQTPAASPKCPN